VQFLLRGKVWCFSLLVARLGEDHDQMGGLSKEKGRRRMGKLLQFGKEQARFCFQFS
jgi:hypothetical protein